MATVKGVIGGLVLLRTTVDLTDDADYAAVPSVPADLLELPAPSVDASLPLQVDFVVELVDAGGAGVARSTATFKCKAINASPKPSSGTLVTDSPERSGAIPGQELPVGPLQAGEKVALRLYGWANAPGGATKAKVYALVRLMPVS